MAQAILRFLGSRFAPRIGAWGARPDVGGQDQQQRSIGQLVRPASGMSLFARFVFAATVILCNGMLLLGAWVVDQIGAGVLQSAATSEALRVQEALEPIILETSQRQDINWPSSSELTSRLQESLHGKTAISSLTIWEPDGKIVYSSQHDLVGHMLPPTPQMAAAMNGNVVTSSLNELLTIRAFPTKELPALVVNAPLRDPRSNEIIAAFQFATTSETPKLDLDAVRLRTWIVVGASTVIMIALLSGVVLSGSRTIAVQRSELERLNERLVETNRRRLELSEQLLHQTGMTLQNGPAQLLALILLRMSELRSLAQNSRLESERNPSILVDKIENATTGALKELRSIEAQLLLPDLQGASASTALESAIRSCGKFNGTRIERQFSLNDEPLPLSLAACMFRFVQQVLFCLGKSPQSQTLKVTAREAPSQSIVIEISATDTPLSIASLDSIRNSLEFQELKSRIESIGGSLTMGDGDRLTMTVPRSI